MSYISVLITQHFFSSGSKNKNIHPKKLSYASGMGSTKKTSSIFSKESFSYISANESSKTETIKKLVNLQSLKKKKTRNTFLKKQNFLIITQNFFSHSVIFFSILNKLLIFIFLQIFVTFTMILLFFFFFSFRKILVSSTTFFFTTIYIYI